jgi:hypothetical protein
LEALKSKEGIRLLRPVVCLWILLFYFHYDSYSTNSTTSHRLDFDEIAKNFDLFFDAGMRWVQSIIEGNKYEDYQVFQRKYERGDVHKKLRNLYIDGVI